MMHQISTRKQAVYFCSIDIHVGSLRNVQDTHLYEASTFFISSDDAKMYIDNSPLKGHPDAGGIFIQTLSGYEAALKEALRAAAKVAVAAWNGESQTEAREFFEREYGRVSGYRYLREFVIDFGVSFPSSDAVLKEGIRLADAQADGFVQNAAKEMSIYARDSRIANMAGPKEIVRSEAAKKAQLSSITAAFEGNPTGYASVVNNYFAAIGSSVRTDLIDVVAYENGGGGQETLVASDTYVETGGVVLVDRSFDAVDVDGERLVFGERLSEALNVPTSDNTMIVVIYGSNQAPGEGIVEGESVEFDNLTKELQKDYDETWAFSPGHNYTEIGGMIGNSPSEAYEEIWEFIQKRKVNNPNINNIVIIGYSWGGGMAHLLTNKIEDEMPNINVAATVLVDAVTLLSTTPVTNIPNGNGDVLNVYQDKVDIDNYGNDWLNGAELKGAAENREIIQVNMDEKVNQHDHLSIDADSQPLIIDFIRNRIIPASND